MAETRSYETRDLSLGGILAFAVAVTAMIAGVLIASSLVLRHGLGSPAPGHSPSALGRLLPPEPRLEVEPGTELLEVRQHENDLLAGYAWIDRDQGIVRIPIERAMALVVERGVKP